jgi:hypothetical protein
LSGETVSSTVSTTEYTVTLNDNQDTQAGGTVTFKTAPPSGARIRIISSVPYLQSAELTSMGAFSPSVLNDVHDKAVAMIQQVADKVERAVCVDATSSSSAEDLKADFLALQEQAATTVTEAYNTLQEAIAKVDSFESQASQREDELNALAEQLKSQTEESLSKAGDDQVQRVTNAGSNLLVQSGISCSEMTWTVETAQDAGTELTLPDDFQYVVGFDHLRLSWNGLQLYKPSNFEEVGTPGNLSSTVKLNMPIAVGDEMNAWTAALGAGDVGTLSEGLNTVTNDLAELSRKVVYKDDQE